MLDPPGLLALVIPVLAGPGPQPFIPILPWVEGQSQNGSRRAGVDAAPAGTTAILSGFPGLEGSVSENGRLLSEAALSGDWISPPTGRPAASGSGQEAKKV